VDGVKGSRRALCSPSRLSPIIWNDDAYRRVLPERSRPAGTRVASPGFQSWVLWFLRGWGRRDASAPRDTAQRDQISTVQPSAARGGRRERGGNVTAHVPLTSGSPARAQGSKIRRAARRQGFLAGGHALEKQAMNLCRRTTAPISREWVLAGRPWQGAGRFRAMPAGSGSHGLAMEEGRRRAASARWQRSNVNGH
jgi:hypothetical protein